MKLPECPFGGVTLGLFDDQADDVPEGCIVWSDPLGRDWLVFAPGVVAQMRHDCPECRGETAHASA